MDSHDRSLSENPALHKTEGGYLPLDTPVYMSMWKLRKGEMPKVDSCFLQSSASLKPRKKNRKFKTPRLMLPILLG